MCGLCKRERRGCEASPSSVLLLARTTLSMYDGRPLQLSSCRCAVRLFFVGDEACFFFPADESSRVPTNTPSRCAVFRFSCLDKKSFFQQRKGVLLHHQLLRQVFPLPSYNHLLQSRAHTRPHPRDARASRARESPSIRRVDSTHAHTQPAAEPKHSNSLLKRRDRRKHRFHPIASIVKKSENL